TRQEICFATEPGGGQVKQPCETLPERLVTPFRLAPHDRIEGLLADVDTAGGGVHAQALPLDGSANPRAIDRHQRVILPFPSMSPRRRHSSPGISSSHRHALLVSKRR